MARADKKVGDELPPIGGTPPPKLGPRAGDAIDEVKREYPYIEVRLDYGSFMNLWRMAENKLAAQTGNPARHQMMPWATELYRRQVVAFREAHAAMMGAVAAPRAKKLLKRR